MVEWRDKERNRFPFGPLRKKLTRFVRSLVRDPPTYLPPGVVPSRRPIRWWTRLYLWRGRSERVQTRRGQPTKEAETGRWEMERGVGEFGPDAQSRVARMGGSSGERCGDGWAEEDEIWAEGRPSDVRSSGWRVFACWAAAAVGCYVMAQTQQDRIS